MNKVWLKISIAGSEECWNWQGGKDTNGYGVIQQNNIQTRTHRLVFELINNCKLESKEFICHSCDNPSCYNPKHLFKGDAKINAQDMAAKGRVKGGGPRKFDRALAQELLDSGIPVRQAANKLGVSHSNLLKAKKRGQITY